MNKQPRITLKGQQTSFLVLLGICTLALGALFYSVYGLQPQDVLTVGEPSPRTYIAPVSTEIIDRLATERERQGARSQIAPIIVADPELTRLVQGAISTAGLPAAVQDLLLGAYSATGGVNAAQLNLLTEQALAITEPGRQREVRLFIEQRLLPTAVENMALTESLREAVVAAVRPVMQRLEAGQTIIGAGTTLTEDHLAVLEELGLYSARADTLARQLRILGSALMLAILMTLPFLYVKRKLTQLTLKQLGFLMILTLITITGQHFLFMLDTHIVFTSLVTILIAVLMSELLAVLWTVWMAVALAVLNPAGAFITLAAVLLGGVAASLSARAFHNRTSLLLAGLAGGGAACVGYLIVRILYGGHLTLSLLPQLGLLALGHVLGGILALGLLPLAESAFDFLTEFRLVELSNPSNPLLQRLLLEAPGTYQHSLIISNLVEQAVTNVGGDALLARVGALYHDVGKLKRPHFFTENQFSGDNPHNQLSPHLSYLIIVSHVRDGLELLREYKLPRILEPFASEHHGTTVQSYFYKQALERDESVEDLSFRYPGPKPRSKETAILMLADAVESASRTLADPSPSSIRALIDRLFELRLQDGQLAESPLNLHDLEVIANTFERMMTAILHRRIHYPSQEEIQRLRRAGDNRRDTAVPATTHA